MENGLKTLYTLLIYLNGTIKHECINNREEKTTHIQGNKALLKMRGGETIFYGQCIKFNIKKFKKFKKEKRIES